MAVHVPRYAVILAAVATAAAATAAAVTMLTNSASAARASDVQTASICRPRTEGIGRNASAAQIVRTMQANIPNACGFTVTGQLLGADFGIDGTMLAGPTAYDGQGQAHVMYDSQGVVLDFYRVGGADYVRLYEAQAPTGVPDLNVTTLWTEFGVSSSVVHKAGSTKWVRLTSAQERAFNRSDMLGVLGAPSSLAVALADGAGGAWKLSGTKVVDGIRCAAVTDVPKDRQELAETIYVNDKTGLPVTVRYAVRGGTAPAASFSHWSSTAAITRPAQVVTG